MDGEPIKKTYVFKKKSTGKTYTMQWDDPDTTPTKTDMDQYAWEEDNKSPIKKAADWAMTPLVDIRGRMDAPTRAANEQFVKDYPKLGTAGNMVLDTMSGMSSPLSIGLLGAEAAAPVAGRLNPSLGRALRMPSKVAAGGALAHGGYRLATEPTGAGKLGGAVEAGLGALGLRGGPKLEVDASGLPISDIAEGSRRIGRGRVLRTGASSLDAPIEGEFTEVPQGAIEGPPARRALPPAVQPSFYGGRRGLSPNIDAVTDVSRPPISVDEAAFNALIPERYKPTPSNKGTMGAYEHVPISDDVYTGTGKLDEVTPKQSTSSVATGDRPFAKFGDDDVAFLAESGDKEAVAEARQRPSIAQRFLKNEKGAIGDQSGPKTTKELAGSLKDESGREIAPAQTTQKPTISELDMEGHELSDQGRSSATSWFQGLKDVVQDENGFLKLNRKDKNPYLDRFAQWVNNVKATKIEGLLKRREFADLDSEGFDAIHRYQSGDRSGRLANVEQFFQRKLFELRKAGVRLGEHENYLPQIWADDSNVVKEVYRRLGLKPTFTQKRIFEDYVQGIAAGLHPKFQTIGELAGWYEQKANKAIADREFYNMGREQGWIRPQGKGEENWKILDPNHFPAAYSTTNSGGVRQVPMTAPPEMHGLISNYLGEPNKIMQWMADKASISKNLALSSGVPMTGINAHGFNILARTVIGNPKAALTAGKYILAPKMAGKALDAALETAPWAVKRGLQLSTEGHEMGVTGSTNLAGRGLQGFLKLQGKLFEDPLFQKIIPALKLKHFNDVTDDLVKGGMPRIQAGEQAASFTNNLYGGINWEAMGRSRDLQNLARMFILAPDWAESNLRLGAGMGKTLLDPKSASGRQYAKMARNIIGAYVAADVVNHTLNGHHMWENAAGHALDIQAGQTPDGKDRWIRPFGTATDFIRLPIDMASGAIRTNPDLGTPMDIAKNRLSIPARTGLDFLTKRDRQNKPFLGKDDYGRPISLEKQITGGASEASQLILPPYVKSVIDYGTGRTGAEEALAGTGEMPVRYSKAPKFRRMGRSR